VAGPAGPVCPQHVGELSADAWKGVSLYRGHPVEPATADCSGEYAGRTAEAEIPWQAHRGGHGAEVPDRGLRRPHRCQAERDHPEEPGPDDRSAAGTPHYTVHSLPRGDSETAGCSGKGAAALPDVLSALHVHRLPPGGAVRLQVGGFQVQQKRSAPDHQPLPQRCPREGSRGRSNQEWPQP